MENNHSLWSEVARHDVCHIFAQFFDGHLLSFRTDTRHQALEMLRFLIFDAQPQNSLKQISACFLSHDEEIGELERRKNENQKLVTELKEMEERDHEI